jgi:ABC-type dipeptide/oligopeptide/nickel transport system permease component
MAISMIAYLILSCISLFQTVSDDTRKISLTKEPYFWIATGMIVFSIVTIVITGLHTYIVENKIQIAGKNIHHVIMPMVNVVLYSCFAYSFYLCRSYNERDQSLKRESI